MSFTVYFLNRFRTFPSFPSLLPFSTFRPSFVTILVPLSLCKDPPASRPPLSLHLGHCCWASRRKNQIVIMPALCWRFPFPLLSLASFVHPFKHSSRAAPALLVCSERLHPGGHCTSCLALAERGHMVKLFYSVFVSLPHKILISQNVMTVIFLPGNSKCSVNTHEIIRWKNHSLQFTLLFFN